MTPRPNVMTAVLSQHAEEAAFQWLLRDEAVAAPHYSLSDLAHLDDLVSAHLDGLQVAGESGWDICRQELAWQEPGELFTAAVLAFASGLADRIEAVVTAATDSPEAAPGLGSALGWLPYDIAKPHLETLLQADVPRLRRLGLAAMAHHRVDPGPVLVSALQDIDPVVTPRALRLAGELGRQNLLPQCRELLTSDADDIRFWATWAVMVLGDKTAADGLCEWAISDGPRAEFACTAAWRGMAPGQALRRQQELAAQPSDLRLAALAAGACSDPQLVPWLIEIMAEDEPARAAGEAFSMITGVDLAISDLERDRPEDFQAGPTEDPADEDVDLDPDEDLPWPDGQLVAAWWKTHGGRFEPGRRYLVGQEIAEKSLQNILHAGRQRQRAAAALELILLAPGRPLFEVRSRGDRQLQLLKE